MALKEIGGRILHLRTVPLVLACAASIVLVSCACWLAAADSQSIQAGQTVVVANEGAEFVLPGQSAHKLPAGTEIHVVRTTERAVAGYAVVGGTRTPGWIRLSDVRPREGAGVQPPVPGSSARPSAPATRADPVVFQIEARSGWSCYDLEYSPDGKRLLGAGMNYEDPDLRLWNAADGGEVASLRGKPWGNRTAAFSGDGELVASASHGVQMWRTRSGENLWSTLDPTRIQRVAFSPDGKLLACAGQQKVTFLDAASGEKRGEIPVCAGTVYDVVFFRDGKRIAAAGVDRPFGEGAIKIFDVDSGRLLREMSYQRPIAIDIDLSPAEDRLASCGVDGGLHIWNLETGEQVDSALGEPKVILRAVAWSPDGRLLACGGDDKAVRLWHAAESKVLLTASVPCQTVLDVEFSPDGQQLAVASREGPVIGWSTARLLASADAGPARPRTP